LDHSHATPFVHSPGGQGAAPEDVQAALQSIAVEYHRERRFLMVLQYYVVQYYVVQ
jgi:hypothetical protein